MPEALDFGTGGPSALDVITQQEQLARRRKLMDALTQANLQTPIKGNLSQGLGQLAAKLATAYIQNKNEGQMGQEVSANRAEYGKQLGEGAGKFMDTYNGRSGAWSPEQAAQFLGGNDASTVPNVPDTVKADKRRAVVEALTSQLPEIQQLGKQSMAGLQKEQLSQKDILGLSGYSANSKLAAALSGNLAGLTPEQKQHIVNGQVVQAAEGGPAVASGDFRDKFNPVGQVGNDANGKPLIGQTAQVTGEAKFAPAGQTINIDNVGTKDALGQAGEVLKGARSAMIQGQGAFQDANRMYQLASDPQVMTGFGANQAMGMGALAAKLGLMGPDAVAKTQELAANLSKRTLEAGQQMKGSFSDKDIEFLKSVSDGSIALTPQVLKRAAEMSMVAAHNSMMQNRDQINSISTIPGVENLMKLQPMPQFSNAFPNSAMYSPIGDTPYVKYHGGAGSPNAKGTQKILSIQEFLAQ